MGRLKGDRMKERTKEKITERLSNEKEKRKR